jgi:hypothetical protein
LLIGQRQKDRQLRRGAHVDLVDLDEQTLQIAL